MLLKLKKHLQKQHTVNMYDLSHTFRSDPEVVRQMLAIFIQKGKVREVQRSESCGNQCQRCDPLLTEIYEWN